MLRNQFPSNRTFQWLAFTIPLFCCLGFFGIHSLQAQYPQGILQVIASPDGSRLAIGGTNGLLKIADAVTLADQVVIPDLSGTIGEIGWKNDGLQIATDYINPRQIRIWNANTGQLVRTFPMPLFSGVQGAAWNHNDAYFAIYIRNETDPSEVLIYNTATFTEQCRSVFPGPVSGISWHPTNHMLAASYVSGIRLINPSNCNEQNVAALTSYVSARAFNPTGTILAVGNEFGSVSLLDTTTYTVLDSYTLHSSIVTTLSWHPNDQQLVSASQDGTISVLNTSTGLTTQSYTYTQLPVVVRGIAFSPDGTRILFGDGTEIRSESALPPPPTATPTPTSTVSPTSTPTP